VWLSSWPRLDSDLTAEVDASEPWPQRAAKRRLGICWSALAPGDREFQFPVRQVPGDRVSVESCRWGGGGPPPGGKEVIRMCPWAHQGRRRA
jgi:hypothetical protein